MKRENQSQNRGKQNRSVDIIDLDRSTKQNRQNTTRKSQSQERNHASTRTTSKTSGKTPGLEEHSEYNSSKRTSRFSAGTGRRGAAGTTSAKSIRKKSGRNTEFAIVAYIFMALFLILIAYFIYFQVFKSDEVINNAYNPRLQLYAEHIIRGDIESADGKTLATTKVSGNGTQTREYPYKNLFAHAVGFDSNGMSGIELQANFSLLRSHSFFAEQLVNDLKDEKNQGDTVITTLNYEVQKAASDALGDKRGAVVVLQPSTGKILAMVSKPDFNPNTIQDNWDDIVSDDSSTVLLNRATQGLYPPGSTFKIVTTLEYIRENGKNNTFSFDCNGKVEVNGVTIHCYGNKSHGQEDLATAFAKSCNGAYSTIGLGLNLNKYADLTSDLLFNQDLPTTVTSSKSRFSLGSDAGTSEIMQTAIGQGNTLVTPLHMAMIAAAIDNKGVLMKPYILDHVENDGGFTVKSWKSSEYGSLMTEDEASYLQTLMQGVVADGTGTKLSGQSYQAAGKTGSAEYGNDGKSHGWFVGYGSKEGYDDIAVAVIVEDGDSGSASAVPVTKKVFDKYFNLNNKK